MNELDANWMGSLRIRAGYAFDRALVYVTGGYAWMDADGNDKAPGVSDVSYSLQGTTLGAGVEYAFTDRLSGRLEYRHTDYDSKRESYQCGGHCYDLAVNPEIDSFRVGVNYRF